VSNRLSDAIYMTKRVVARHPNVDLAAPYPRKLAFDGGEHMVIVTLGVQTGRHVALDRLYIMLKPTLNMMSKIEDGAVLFYADAGIEIIKPLWPLVELCCAQDIVLFEDGGGHRNFQCTKRDCFELMGCDTDSYYDACQVSAGFQVYRKSQKSLDFLREWLAYCQNPNIITDAPNIWAADNLPGFIDHRHDQAVISLLARKYELELFRDASQWGNHLKMECFREAGEFTHCPYSSSPMTNSPYATLINHHRSKALVGRRRYMEYARSALKGLLRHI